MLDFQVDVNVTLYPLTKCATVMSPHFRNGQAYQTGGYSLENRASTAFQAIARSYNKPIEDARASAAVMLASWGDCFDR